MIFIHGAVVWSDGRSDIESEVRIMGAALVEHPWRSTAIREVQSHSAVGAFAAQSTLDHGATDATGATADPAVDIIADLRLDNIQELRSLVGGRASATATTPSLLAGLYRQIGIGCVRHLLGDGTFALWDSEHERLLCWRDAAGSRPLFYHAVAGRHVVFSSDLRALTANPRVPRRLDLAYCRSLLEIGPDFHHPSRTLCQGVLKVPAGHYLVADKSGCRTVRYWDPGELAERRYRDETEYVEELRALLESAVACRLPPAPGLVAAHLSGGLDSSSVAVVAQRHLHKSGRTVRGVSWAPPLDVVGALEQDERVLAQSVADRDDIPLHFTTITVDDFLELERRDHSVQPTTTLHAELAASRASAACGVSTVLSGWGGDELAVFNGRGYFADLARRGRWLRLRHELLSRSNLHDASPLAALRGQVLFPFIPDVAVRRFRPQLDLESYALPPALRPEFRHELLAVEALPDRRPRTKPGVRRMQRALLDYGHLQYRMESWASHGAGLGLTYRFPLLDRRIMEFALTIPDHLYFKDGWKRWLYRTAMQGILPDEVRWHPTKHDNALGHQMNAVRPQTGARGRDQLRLRADNPYLDVERLAAPDPATDRSPAKPTAPYHATVWLAFTDVPPP